LPATDDKRKGELDSRAGERERNVLERALIVIASMEGEREKRTLKLKLVSDIMKRDGKRASFRNGQECLIVIVGKTTQTSDVRNWRENVYNVEEGNIQKKD